MNAIKKIYNKLPETINVPEEFIHKKGEIIFIMDDELQLIKNKTVKDFHGAIPDFPERSSQGNYEKRAELEIAGTPIGPYDLQIGAVALINNFILVTNNFKEFSRIKNLVIEDWG